LQKLLYYAKLATNEEVIMKTIIAITFLIAFSLISTLGASVYDFLNVGIAARPNAMGGSFSAVSNDIDALHWNPSGLNGIGEGMLSSGLVLYVADIKFGEVSYGLGKGKNTFGFGLNYVNYGSIEKRGENNEDLGSFTPMDMVFISGMSRSVTEDLSLGLGVKLVYEKIDSFVSYGAGADVGMQYLMRERHLTIAFVARNIGKEFKAHYEDKGSFPLSVTGGFSFHPIPVLNINFDLTKVLADSRTIAGAGVEWWVVPIFVLRSGYSNAAAELKNEFGSDIMAGTSFGFGFLLKKFGLDYAIEPKVDFGFSHSVTLSHIF